MSFFGKPLSQRRIILNPEATSSESPEMLKRLHRIETNYSRLNDILSELEMKFELDDRLTVDLESELSISAGLPKKPR